MDLKLKLYEHYTIFDQFCCESKTSLKMTQNLNNQVAPNKTTEGVFGEEKN